MTANKRAVEPGLMPIFSLYFQVRLGVILASGLVYFAGHSFALGPELAPYVVLFVGDLVFLFAFLSSPVLPRRLGSLYLPFALAAASVIPIIEARYLAGVYGGGYVASQWLVFPFLSVPLILIAWQYDFDQVLVFAFGTSAFELAMSALMRQVSLEGLPSQVDVILARSAFFILVGYIVSNLVAAQRRQRQELDEAHRKLLRYTATLEELAVSRERNRLARELHDTLAHTLSGLAVQLDAIATVWQANPDRARAMVERALAATRAGLEETRRALQDLRAAPLEDLGLALALRSLAESVAGRSGLALQVDVAEPATELPPEVEQTYYRVAQEALENVARHANARRVWLALRLAGGELALEVVDDGEGFSADPGAGECQFGLVGMRERAELIGATLEVESLPSRGTTVRLRRRMAV